MRPKVAVIDTNVLVSGLITQDTMAPVCRIVDGMLIGAFPFLFSQALLEEYRKVLLRPGIQKFHRLSDQEVDTVLEEIVVNGIWREVTDGPQAPDSGDNHIWALLNSHPGSVLVTGDKLLIRHPPDFASVMLPKNFIQQWN